MLFKLALTAVLSFGICAADTIVANGAGPLPGSAENLSGDDSLTNIVGAISDPLGVNVFEINLLRYQDFSAITVPVGAYGIPDTELFLFDASGHGVYGNDDISGSNTLSCLPSAASTTPCGYAQSGAGPTSNGLYYLAITRSLNAPVNGINEIFPNLQPGAATGPDPSVGSLDGWDNGVLTSPDFDLIQYSIVLTGTSPEPATWGLLGGAALALFLLRRKLVTN